MNGHSVLLVSLPGHSGSGNASEWFSEFMREAQDFDPEGIIIAEFLKLVLPQCGHESVYAAGHSMGAQILAHAAQDSQELIKRLILITPSGLPNHGAPWWNKLASSNFLTRFLLLAASGLQTRLYQRKELPLQFGCLKPSGPFWWRGRHKQRLNEARRLQNPNLAEVLNEVSCPTLAIFGERDWVIDPSSHYYLPPNVETLIHERFTHNPTLFLVNELAEEITRFIDS